MYKFEVTFKMEIEFQGIDVDLKLVLKNFTQKQFTFRTQENKVIKSQI